MKVITYEEAMQGDIIAHTEQIAELAARLNELEANMDYIIASDDALDKRAQEHAALAARLARLDAMQNRIRLGLNYCQKERKVLAKRMTKLERPASRPA